MQDKAAIAIDLGGTRIKVGLTRGENLLLLERMDSLSHFGLKERLPRIVAKVNTMLAEAGLAASDLAGVGIAVPGIVDSVSRRVLSINAKYADAPEIDLAAWVREVWALPLLLENDTRAALLGEWQYGNGRGYDNVVLMTLGTGIGTSAVIEGQLLRGKHFQAGILGGHFVVNYHGRRCNCGNIGCAEAEASTWSLQQKLSTHPQFPESMLSCREKMDFEAVFECAERGDALATAVRNESLEVWAACALNLVQAYDPELLILGGGVMGSSDVIIPRIRSKLDGNAWVTWGKVAVVPASLLHSAALLGMSHLVYNHKP